MPAKVRQCARQITTFDDRSLALFRIMLGIVTIVDLLDRASVFEAMYSETGLIPLEVVRETYGRTPFGFKHFSLHMLNGSQFYQAGLFCIAGLCALCVSLGYRTRLFVIASWFLHASIMTRDPVIGSAADVTLGLALFWGIFLPLGNRFSLDRLTGRTDSLGPIAHRLGVLCYLLQLFTIYVCAAYAKDFSWRNGSALMHIMQIDLLATSSGRYLTNFPVVLWILTLAVWWIEAVGTLLLFFPFRVEWARGLCFLLFFGLHLGIALTCSIGPFALYSIVLWLPVIPGLAWDLFRIRQEPSHQPVATSRLRNLKQTFYVCVASGSILAIMMTTFPVGPMGVLGKAAGFYVSRTKLSQAWSVFTKPKAMNRDGWFIVEGTLEDGTTIDLLRDNEPVQWSRPALSGPRRVSVTWRTYLVRQERGAGENLDHFASYLHRKQKRIDGHGFDKIRMIFMQETDSANDEAIQHVFWSGIPSESR